VFRPYELPYPGCNLYHPAPDPEDNGYNFKHTGNIKIVVNTLKDNGFR